MTADERLVRIEVKLDRLMEATASSVALHDACRKQQCEHHATLYGNDRDGLKGRVASLENSRWYGRVGIGALWALFLASVAGSSVFFKWLAKVL